MENKTSIHIMVQKQAYITTYFSENSVFKIDTYITVQKQAYISTYFSENSVF
jgi:hypothetical protein